MQTEENNRLDDSSQVKESQSSNKLDMKDKESENRLSSSVLRRLEEEPSMHETHYGEMKDESCCKEKGKSDSAESKDCNTAEGDHLVLTAADTRCSCSEHTKYRGINEMEEVAAFCNTLSNVILQENSFILDIDMDYFSTQNPFKLLYTEVSTKFLVCHFNECSS